MKPLHGILVLEFSNRPAGIRGALRLADLGARVIRVEAAGHGPDSRTWLLYDRIANDDGFRPMNRNKESYVARMQENAERQKVRKLVAAADVLIHDAPSDMLRQYGLDYEQVKALNPRLVYASVTGYGNAGPWQDEPCAEMLIQALSGMTWLNGNDGEPPLAFGLDAAGLFASAHLVQGILAALVRRGKTNEGGLVEVSLLESALDFQFEVLTTHLNDGGKLPQRSRVNNAHAYLAAPYGIYKTKDGFLALAMGSIPQLAQLLKCPALQAFTDPQDWFTRRDDIKRHLADRLATQPTAVWLKVLEAADYWCAEVFTLAQLHEHKGFQVLDMVQDIVQPNGARLRTTRCPIRIDGGLLKADKGVLRTGEDNERLEREFALYQPARGAG